MSIYMYQAVYSKDSISGLVKNPQDRTNAINAVVETNGGTLIGCWLAFGEYDLVVIAEMPRDEAMAGVVLAVSAVGTTAGGKTTKLLTMEQAVKAMTGAKAVVDNYSPPSN